MPEFQRRLVAVINADLRTCLADHQPAGLAENVQLDFTDVRVRGRSDAADTQRPDHTVLHLQRHRRQVLDIVVEVGLVEV